MLEACNLTKSYGGRRVVDGVSFSVARGEVVGLLGPNGAGKTTTFHMVIGFIAAERGEVRLDGRRISDRAFFERARAGIGYLPQEPSVFTNATVNANLRLGPGTDTERIGLLAEGEKITAVARLGSWFQVRTENGETAWLHRSVVN
jgi:ABC-type lipopolysaccharide export system ATPase subunit